MEGFREGYEYFQQNVGASKGAFGGSAYVERIVKEINELTENMNAMSGYKTAVDKLKGDAAEFWHSGTFNIDAAVKDSANRTKVDRSHEFASSDITSNFGKNYGLKYYTDGAKSAKQQAKTLLERYKEYQSQGGKDTLAKYMADRGYDPNDSSVLHDPIYSEQYRLVPADQLKAAKQYLREKIAKEKATRPEQVKRYEDTLKKICSKITDGDGNESVPLTKEESEELARLAKEGGFDPADWGLTTEKLVTYHYVLEQAVKAGTTAAVISVVLKVAPEIYRMIAYLVQHGEIDPIQFRRIGFAALSGGAEGFVRGGVAAALTISCKAGLLGDAMKAVEPSVIGAVTVLVMSVTKNAFSVAAGRMERKKLTDEFVQTTFISACSLAVGGIVQGMLLELPSIGFMLGSFIGSMFGGLAYSAGYQTVLSFCVDTGFTMFGLVDQDYVLPRSVLEQIGIELFEYEKFSYPKFDYAKASIERVSISRPNIQKVGITFLRRGVIGIREIGYV